MLKNLQAVLAKDERYFHCATIYVSFGMPFLFVQCHFSFEILSGYNKGFPLF